MKLFYKATRPDGWDFQTGKTINYRECLQKGIPAKCPAPNKALGLCSDGVIHASKTPDGVFAGAKLPLALFRVKGIPLLAKEEKYGFCELEVLEELDPAKVFEWNYAEAVNPIRPFAITPPIISDKEIALLKEWVEIRASAGARVMSSVMAPVMDSVMASVLAPVMASVMDSAGSSVMASVRASVMASAGSSVMASVMDSVLAYIGHLFAPVVKKWDYVENHRGIYPFQSAVDLWRRGLVASFDGNVWRLHGGTKAEILWEGVV